MLPNININVSHLPHEICHLLSHGVNHLYFFIGKAVEVIDKVVDLAVGGVNLPLDANSLLHYRKKHDQPFCIII
jgi:hypothetical protein